MKRKTILSIICCLLVVCVLTGCGIGNSSKDDTKDYNISIKQIDGVDTKAYISSGQDQLIVSVTNNSGKMIGSGYISVSYYDENDKKITIYGTDDTRYNMFENGGEVVYGFELPTEGNVGHYIPTRTEVEVTMDNEYQEDFAHIMEDYVENFTYSHTTTNEKVNVILKNNASDEETAPRLISVVFYKNNRPVYSRDIMFMFTEVAAGQTTTREFDIPSDYKKTKESGQSVLIDYDDIKIYRVVDASS